MNSLLLTRAGATNIMGPEYDQVGHFFGHRKSPKIAISGPRNGKNVATNILGPETDQMVQFLGPDIVQKFQFQGPERVKMMQQKFRAQKLTKWCNFWPQKLTLWASKTKSREEQNCNICDSTFTIKDKVMDNASGTGTEWKYDSLHIWTSVYVCKE